MSDRLPVRPPPRALHWIADVASPGPVCGTQPRGALHVTTNPRLATCPRCRAVLVRRPLRCCVCDLPAGQVVLQRCEAPQPPYGTCDRPICVGHAVPGPLGTVYCVHHEALATSDDVALSPFPGRAGADERNSHA